MASGLCCLAQQRGDLGKPLNVLVHHKNGTTSQRCGVCEVVPSCRDQSKMVFAFRWLKSQVCGIPGKAHCKPTAAGAAQYRAQIPIAAAGRERVEYFFDPSDMELNPRAITNGAAYMLPNP